MRWFVFFLLVLNGITYFWFAFQQGQEAQMAQVRQQAEFDFKSVPSVKLKSELTGLLLAKEGVASEKAQPVVAVQCALLGPFREVISARQVRIRLQKQGLSARIVLLLKPLPPVHWVYIEPQATRQQALELLKVLHAEKVDSFLIDNGEFQNGISLGFYSKSESADAVLAKYKNSPLDVKQMLRDREKKDYWLAFDEAGSTRISENLIETLRHSDFDVKKQEKSCADIALLKTIE